MLELNHYQLCDWVDDWHGPQYCAIEPYLVPPALGPCQLLRPEAIRNDGRYGKKMGWRGLKIDPHQLVWQESRGVLYPGHDPDAHPWMLVVDHLCANKHCIAPAHLQLVTHGINQKRARKAKAEAAA